MVMLPERNIILEKLENGEVENNPRPYLGYSMIGEQCLRYLQYYHRLAYKNTITRRIKRLFNFGKYMENVFYEDLKAVGCKIGDTQTEMVGASGHWKGHCDGTLMQVPGAEKTKHLLECKTHNDDQFKKLQKAGEVRKTHFKHFAQSIMYMGKMKLTRALYLGYNKNDSAYYIERIHFDKEEFEELEFKENAVISNVKLFPRIGNGKETWHECRFCDAKKVCFNKVAIERNCRTCEHVEMHSKGKWLCGVSKIKKELTLDAQMKACPKYELDVELR